jgi:hypothetical protein
MRATCASFVGLLALALSGASTPPNIVQIVIDDGALVLPIILHCLIGLANFSW